MCGIIGIYQHLPKRNVNLEKFMGLMRHRGPDAKGTYVDPKNRLNIGFVRLSIIDLKTGNQPVSNENGKVIAVCNGEIYNFIELTDALKSKGHIFESHGDAETIVHLYEELGEAFLQRLEGMFALALWDEKMGRLILARDRLGIKPLYYCIQNGAIAFASEIKPLLRMPCVNKDCFSERGIIQYLSHGYTLAPDTIFKDIKKLLPGKFITVENGSIEENSYWDCNKVCPQNGPREEIEEHILELFDQSIRLHLRSDVPVGAYLSGGIDSSFLVARAASLHPKLKTYTLGFANSSLDETILATQVAQQYGTDHHNFSVKPANLLKLLPKMVWYCDEPIADSGLLPNFIIGQLAARDGVKVVLNGAGGDELFAGYTYYFPTNVENKLLKVPLITEKVASLLGPFDPELKRKLKRALDYKVDEIGHFIGHNTVWPIHEIQNMLGYEYFDDSTIRDYARSFRGDSLNAKLYCDLKTYLADDILLLSDRMSMAHSLELRVPFLHHPLVEFAMGIPGDIKAPGGERKGLLRNVARPFLPESLFNESKKGFSSPIGEWIFGPLGESVRRILFSDRIFNRPWWNSHGLNENLLNTKVKNNTFHKLYTIFMLEIFCRVHVDNSFDTPPEISLKELIYE